MLMRIRSKRETLPWATVVVVVGMLAVVVFRQVWGEEVVLTTYYPAPYGKYNRIRTTGQTTLAEQGGNVGIGTTSPTGPFQVSVPTASNALRVNSDGTVGVGHPGGGGVTLTIGGPLYVGANALGGTDAGFIRTLSGAFELQGSARYIRHIDDNPIAIGGTTMNRDTLVVVPSSGNVGIGTTNPAARLSVAGRMIADAGMVPTTGAQVPPPCDPTRRGLLWFTPSDAGAGYERLMVCMRGGTSGVFQWVTVADSTDR